jgi:excisionase family DNA binding protein
MTPRYWPGHEPKYGFTEPTRTRTFLSATSHTAPVTTGRVPGGSCGNDRKATMAMASMAVNELGPMLTATEVAEMLHLHVNTVKRLGDRGELPFYRVCKRGDRRFRLEDVLRFLHQNR